VQPERGVLLAPHTSLRVGGAADAFVLARSGQDLAQALRWGQDAHLTVRVIGGGSNLLVADAGFEGVIVKAGATGTRVADDSVWAEAGVTLANLARRLAKQGYSGLEWAANVPGTVGGAAVNNAGAFGGDTAGCLLALTLVDADGRHERLRTAQLEYGYRTSLLKRGELRHLAVESVELRLQTGAPGEPEGKVREFNAVRMRSQPRVLSAGSVFANPAGDFAGRLIEAAGLKGARTGGAQISEQHANFIVNPGGATANDVYVLMRLAQTRVFEQFGIWLRPEIELLGRWMPEQRAALANPEAIHA
jgi:UDP-N-acetylmuramate dehydrogenase